MVVLNSDQKDTSKIWPKLSQHQRTAVLCRTILQKDLERIQKNLESLKNTCNHPDIARTIINKSSTGNYDPSSDSYWEEHHCSVCDKAWIIDAN